MLIMGSGQLITQQRIEQQIPEFPSLEWSSLTPEPKSTGFSTHWALLWAEAVELCRQRVTKQAWRAASWQLLGHKPPVIDDVR